MKFLQILWAALCEIFDEAPYRRFLNLHNIESSPAAYGRFLEERRENAERRFKCC